MPNRPILIVDDEPQNLAAMREVLEDSYTLAFANNSLKGLELVSKIKPSLILLDIEMPEINGFEFCKRLKSDRSTKNIPVIFVTGKSEQTAEEHGFECGAVDFIQKPVSAPVVLARVRTHLSLVKASHLERSHREAIAMLGMAGHYNDNDTGVHIWRMAEYASVLASASGWSDYDSQMLKMAAPMHDMGKIGIPREILCKPAKLDAEEWKIMKSHTRIGHDILIHSKAPLFQMAASVALHHHEKWDGSGYPDGLSGTNIPEAARIVAIADVFDALTMKRPYKDAWPVNKALALIKEDANTHFDPRQVEIFVSSIEEILEVKDHWDSQENNPSIDTETTQQPLYQAGMSGRMQAGSLMP